MKAIQHHIYGIKVTFETLSKGQLLIYFLPGAIIGLLFGFVFTFTSQVSDSAQVLNDVPLIGEGAASMVTGTVSFFDTILTEIFKFTVLTLLSPFNCLLSEKFDNKLSGNKFDGGFIRIMNDVLRAMLIVVLALIFEFFFMGAWWFFSWIFGLGILNPFVYFIISSFFFGFAFYDFSLERYGFGTFSSWGMAFSNMLHMIITGALFTLLFLIPYIGIVTAPVLVTMISTGTFLKMYGKPAPPATV